MPENGDRFVTRHEWEAHCQSVHAIHDQHEERLRSMERRWDRIAGPVVILLVVLGAVGTIASVWNAVSS